MTLYRKQYPNIRSPKQESKDKTREDTQKAPGTCILEQKARIYLESGY